MTEDKSKGTRSEATAKIVLSQPPSVMRHLPKSFAVDLGLRRIMRFYIRPRRTTTHSHKVVTTRKDVAIVGWRSGSLSGKNSCYDSLYNVVCDLAGYGLQVDAVLDAAKDQGWPDDIVAEAQERAEETYRYLAEQGWPS